ncbi:MAG: hypothetical protein ABI791_07710 [Acidobacteriota bacterium]
MSSDGSSVQGPLVDFPNMCTAVYIAANNPLPLIEWQEKVTPFCVTGVAEDEQGVKKHFTKPHIVYAGSFEGCGCGFYYDSDPIDPDDEYEKERDAMSRESVRQLSSYLREAVKGGTVEMFVCWESEQANEPSRSFRVTPDFFGGDEFFFGPDDDTSFEETTFFTVVRDKAENLGRIS